MSATRRAPLALLLLAALPARGQQGTEITASDLARLGFFQDFAELSLEELLTTGELRTELAARAAETPEQAPGVVSVVTAEQIRQLGARTLDEVLRTVAGLDVVTTNLGRSRYVVRGILPDVASGGSDGVLLLMNGRRLNEELSGGATLANLSIPVEAVSRVEVLRGPASAAHGGGALAAVINVVTFGADEFQGISASGGVGSFDAGELALRIGNRIGGVGLAGYVHFLDHSGAKLPVPEDAQTRLDREQPGSSPISLAPGRTSDALRTLETNYRASFRELTAGVRVKAESSGGLIGATDALGRQNDVNNRQLGAELGWRRALRGGAALGASVAYVSSEIRELLELFPPGFERPTAEGDGVTRFPNGALLQSSLNSRRYEAEAVYESAELGRHRFVLGAGFARESSYGLEVRANLDYRDGTPRAELTPLSGALRDVRRSVGSAFFFDTLRLSSRASATLGGRWDHGSDYGDEFSPHAALVAAPREDLQLKLVYGRSFRPPSFRELAFELPGYVPGPALRPVRLHVLQGRLALTRGELQLSGTYFLNWLRDAIGPERAPAALAPARLVNLPGADVHGLELELRRSFGLSSAIFASYTFQRAEQRGSGGAVPGVPEDMLSVGGTAAFGRVSASPYLLFRGRRLRAEGDRRSPQDAYALLNLNLRARRIARNLELWATALNLLDAEYADPSPPWGVPADYPRPGRSLFFGAAYTF